MCDPILASQSSSKKCDPIQRHIPISLLLGIPPPPGIKQVSSRFKQSVAVNKTNKLRVNFNFKHEYRGEYSFGGSYTKSTIPICFQASCRGSQKSLWWWLQRTS